MALPYPGKDAVPFTPLTAQFLDEMIANDEALAAGTGFNNGAIPTSAYQDGSVTPVKYSNLYKFSATFTAAQSPGGATKINLGVELYDTNNNFDTSLSRYTAPITGHYHFDAQLTQFIGNGQTQCAIYKNGTVLKYAPLFFNATGGAQNMGSNVSADVKLNAGDYIELYTGAVTTGAAVGGQDRTFLNGHLISIT
jgi:hypothetical protein